VWRIFEGGSHLEFHVERERYTQVMNERFDDVERV
jgi:hypothetical protein